MARIAVGGFQHETNSFVTPDTDFAYFTSHRDRPPLVRGEEVVRALSNTSFALSGFLDAIGDRHEIVPLAVDQRRRRRDGHGGCLRAHRGRARRPPVGGHAGRRRLSRPARRHGDASRSRTAKASCCGGCGRRSGRGADRHQPRLPRQRHARDGRARGQPRRLSHLSRTSTGPRPAHFAARALSLLLERGRPAGRALRKLPFLIPLNDQCTLVEPSRSVVARTARGRGRPRQPLLSCGLPALRPLLVRAGRDRARLDQEAADRAADALAREIALREAEFAVPMVSPDEGVREAMAHRAHGLAAGGALRHAGQSGLRRHGRYDGRARRRSSRSAPRGRWSAISAMPRRRGRRTQPARAPTSRIALGGRSGPEGVTPFEGTFRVARLGNGKMRTTGAGLRRARGRSRAHGAADDRRRRRRGDEQAHAGARPGAVPASGRRAASSRRSSRSRAPATSAPSSSRSPRR